MSDDKSGPYASFEHRRCDELAKTVFEAVCARWSRYMESLPDLRQPKDLPESALVMSIERFRDVVAIGQVGNIDYQLFVRRSDKLVESRVRHPDPAIMNLTSASILEIEIEPVSSKDNLRQPTTSVALCVVLTGDETPGIQVELPVQVTAKVPVARRTQTLPTALPEISIRLTVFDERIANKHILTLEQIARSTDPELGAHSLRGIQEVLEAALAALKG